MHLGMVQRCCPDPSYWNPFREESLHGNCELKQLQAPKTIVKTDVKKNLSLIFYSIDVLEMVVGIDCSQPDL